jgi:hypothetical protein
MMTTSCAKSLERWLWDAARTVQSENDASK